MTALQKNVQTTGFSTDFDVLTSPQKAYTHGFESIYKLECIDLKSVRKFSAEPEKTVEKVQDSSYEEESDVQLTFDFGPSFRGWMVPYLLQEPIQVLQLSKPIEKTLIDKGHKSLGELQQISLQGLGLGQGHIEEIKRKVKQYKEGKAQARTSRIDFESFIKCLFADLEWKKAYVMLAPFEIVKWLQLSPADSADVKKLTFENRQRWCDEVASQLKNESKSLMLQTFFSTLEETWVKPWMMARGGLAKEEEIMESLLIRASDPVFASGALDVLSSIKSPFNALYPTTGGFAATLAVKQTHELMIKTALSYFTSPAMHLSLDLLSTWVALELAVKWKNISPEKVADSIKFSSHFDLFRDSKSGEWIVSKSYFGGK